MPIAQCYRTCVFTTWSDNLITSESSRRMKNRKERNYTINENYIFVLSHACGGIPDTIAILKTLFCSLSLSREIAERLAAHKLKIFEDGISNPHLRNEHNTKTAWSIKYVFKLILQFFFTWIKPQKSRVSRNETTTEEEDSNWVLSFYVYYRNELSRIWELAKKSQHYSKVADGQKENTVNVYLISVPSMWTWMLVSDFCPVA